MTLGQLAILPGHRSTLTDAETRLLDTAADQIALAVERELLRQEALETEVLRRTDELEVRTARCRLSRPPHPAGLDHRLGRQPAAGGRVVERGRA